MIITTPYGFQEMHTEKQLARYCNGIFLDKASSVTVIEAGEGLAEFIEKYMSAEQDDFQDAFDLLYTNMSDITAITDVTLIFWSVSEEIRIVIRSTSKRVRAMEFADFFVEEFGLVKGNASWASARLSQAILQALMTQLTLTSVRDYFLFKTRSYYYDTDWIDAADYSRHIDIKSFPLYQKKAIPWAVVATLDVAAEGDVLFIRSLENESGFFLAASPDAYIMIGIRGEVYDIHREKFERTYERTSEKLDILTQMLDFIPEAEIRNGADRHYISLDEHARLCFPKRDTGIYAIEIKKLTKIFPVSGNDEYYLGRPGDYLAVRTDDINDVYIIQREIFGETYELISD